MHKNAIKNFWGVKNCVPFTKNIALFWGKIFCAFFDKLFAFFLKKIRLGNFSNFSRFLTYTDLRFLMSEGEKSFVLSKIPLFAI